MAKLPRPETPMAVARRGELTVKKKSPSQLSEDSKWLSRRELVAGQQTVGATNDNNISKPTRSEGRQRLHSDVATQFHEVTEESLNTCCN